MDLCPIHQMQLKWQLKKEKKSSILQFKLDSGLSQLEIFLRVQNETLRITWVSLIVI